MSTENNLHGSISDFSPSSVPVLPSLKKTEEQMNAVKALTFIDYIDKCRATAGDDTVLAALPTHLKNDIARQWYHTLVKGRNGEPLRLADDVIWGLTKTYANPEANNIWYKRYDPKVLDAYFESFEFAQRCFYIQNIQDLENENHKLREENEDLKKAMASLSVHSSDGDSSKSDISTPTSSTLVAPSQPHLRPVKVDYYVGAVFKHGVHIPFHDDMTYDELVSLFKSAIEFAVPGEFEDKDYRRLRFFLSRGGYITPDVWTLVRAELKVVGAVFM